MISLLNQILALKCWLAMVTPMLSRSLLFLPPWLHSCLLGSAAFSFELLASFNLHQIFVWKNLSRTPFVARSFFLMWEGARGNWLPENTQPPVFLLWGQQWQAVLCTVFLSFFFSKIKEAQDTSCLLKTKCFRPKTTHTHTCIGPWGFMLIWRLSLPSPLGNKLSWDAVQIKAKLMQLCSLATSHPSHSSQSSSRTSTATRPTSIPKKN